jgi:hypothetical protein
MEAQEILIEPFILPQRRVKKRPTKEERLAYKAALRRANSITIARFNRKNGKKHLLHPVAECVDCDLCEDLSEFETIGKQDNSNYKKQIRKIH